MTTSVNGKYYEQFTFLSHYQISYIRGDSNICLLGFSPSGALLLALEKIGVLIRAVLLCCIPFLLSFNVLQIVNMTKYNESRGGSPGGMTAVGIDWYITHCNVFCDLLQYTNVNLSVLYKFKWFIEGLRDMKKEKQVCWRGFDAICVCVF